MELEQPMLREAPGAQKVKHKNSRTSSSRHRFESFWTLQMGVPRKNSTEKKLSWLRSQIIGVDAEVDSLFGKRRLTYADHTASGRSLQCIENFINKNVLPFYGKFFSPFRSIKVFRIGTY